jgi:hypothetical protein
MSPTAKTGLVAFVCVFGLALSVAMIVFALSGGERREEAVSGPDQSQAADVPSDYDSWTHNDLVRYFRSRSLPVQVSPGDPLGRRGDTVTLCFIADEILVERAKLRYQLSQLQDQRTAMGFKRIQDLQVHLNDLEMQRERANQNLSKEDYEKERRGFQAGTDQGTKVFDDKIEPIQARLKVIDNAALRGTVVETDFHSAQEAQVESKARKEAFELQSNSARMDDQFLVWGKFLFEGDPSALSTIHRTLP